MVNFAYTRVVGLVIKSNAINLQSSKIGAQASVVPPYNPHPCCDDIY